MGFHLARYGLLGHLGQFRSADATIYPRRTRVVLRTPRGMEAGEIVASPEPQLPDAPPLSDATPLSDGGPGWESALDRGEADGVILRRMSVADDLLQARLDNKRDTAFSACQQLLQEAGIGGLLVDVEHLLDGEGLFFYFLGEPPAAAQQVTQQLAATYEVAIEFRRFAQTLEEGCGPGCGTPAAAGQGGCSTCVSCSVASACGSKPSAELGQRPSAG